MKVYFLNKINIYDMLNYHILFIQLKILKHIIFLFVHLLIHCVIYILINNKRLIKYLRLINFSKERFVYYIFVAFFSGEDKV